MRGKTQLEQNNKSKDRNANGRVDPFHMPTELADGLEAESLPRVRRPRLAPAELAPAKAANSTTQVWCDFDPSKTLLPAVDSPRPRASPGELRRFKQVGL